MALSYEEGKKVFLKTILILGAITIGEVAFALVGKGYIIDGVTFPHALIAGVMIILSAVKAYLIIYEFMHMKYEIPGLVRTVLLPGFLLVWGVIAFLWDGNYWMGRRDVDSKQVELKVPTHAEDGHNYDAINPGQYGDSKNTDVYDDAGHEGNNPHGGDGDDLDHGAGEGHSQDGEDHDHKHDGDDDSHDGHDH